MSLRQDSSIVILKADKGNCTVIMNRKDYDCKVLDLLSDEVTYVKLKKDPTKVSERDMNRLLLQLHKDNKLPYALYRKLRSTDALCARLYGLPKIHKLNVPLRPIVSFVNSATYELSKHLCSILSPLLNHNGLSVRDSFEFVSFVTSLKCRDNDVMISCDVTSLFTKVPVDLAIDIATTRLMRDSSLSDRTQLTVNDIVSLLKFCLHASDFQFNSNFYHMSFGCPMGSPVSVIVANMVMEDIEDRILDSQRFDVFCWRRFVDDTWVVLPKTSISDFLEHINSIEMSIKFTMEEEKDNSIPFLDVFVTRNPDHTFATDLYSKPTNSDRLLSFSSHHPIPHKRSVVFSMMKRAQSIPSKISDCHRQEKQSLRVLCKNGFPRTFIEHSLQPKRQIKEPCSIAPTVHVVLPYVSRTSERIAQILRRFNVKVFHKPFFKLSNCFKLPKDPIVSEHVCGVVYKIPCKDCSRIYVGQTANSMKTRLGQHRAALRLLQPSKSAVAEHSLVCDHTIDWTGASVAARERNWRQRLFLESWHSRSVDALNRIELNIPAAYSELC